MRTKTIILSVLSFTIIIVFASFFVVNQMDGNDTWDATHWGGDVGEEEYSTPDVEDEGTNESGGICGSIIIVGVILIPPFIKLLG